MSDVFPGLIDQWEFIDDSYLPGELDEMERQELQQLVSRHPDVDEVDGRDETAALRDALEGKERL